MCLGSGLCASPAASRPPRSVAGELPVVLASPALLPLWTLLCRQPEGLVARRPSGRGSGASQRMAAGASSQGGDTSNCGSHGAHHACACTWSVRMSTARPGHPASARSTRFLPAGLRPDRTCFLSLPRAKPTLHGLCFDSPTPCIPSNGGPSAHLPNVPPSDHLCAPSSHRRSEPSSGRLTRAFGYFPAGLRGDPPKREPEKSSLRPGTAQRSCRTRPRTAPLQQRRPASWEGAATHDPQARAQRGPPPQSPPPRRPRPSPGPPGPGSENPPRRSRGVQPGGGTGRRRAALGSRSTDDPPGLR